MSINGQGINENELGAPPERGEAPGASSEPVDIVGIALSRLTNQFSESPKLRAMVEAMVQPLQDALATIEQLRTERWIDTAVGAQLDGAGYIVGESRNGRDDDAYREAIKFRIFVNVSNGTPADLIQGLKALTKPDDIQYIEQYPATAILFTDGPIIPDGIHSIIQDLAPAAISDVPVMVSYSRARPFRFSRLANDGVLAVNNTSRLTANGNRISITTSSISEQEDVPRLGGIAPSLFRVNGLRLAIGANNRLVANDRNSQTVLESGYHLTGVFQ